MDIEDFIRKVQDLRDLQTNFDQYGLFETEFHLREAEKDVDQAIQDYYNNKNQLWTCHAVAPQRRARQRRLLRRNSWRKNQGQRLPGQPPLLKN